MSRYLKFIIMMNFSLTLAIRKHSERNIIFKDFSKRIRGIPALTTTLIDDHSAIGTGLTVAIFFHIRAPLAKCTRAVVTDFIAVREK